MAEITNIMLLVLLLWKAVTILATQGYLLTGPKSLLPNSVETFCVSFEGRHSKVNCTLELIARDDVSVYASTNQLIEGSKECIKLSVPVTKEASARLRLRLNFDNLPGYTVDATKEVALKQLENIHLIQTDKAWYTPGQLVRFRVLSLNYMLYPLTDPVKRIWIEDSSGATVAQWTNMTSSNGLHQLELQLSTEPVQGTWKIQMERILFERAEQYFEVREYVLPKFEVIINGPPFITSAQEGDSSVRKISISVCAKYSYGQPVRGNWKANIQITDDGRYYGWRNKENGKFVNFNRTGVLNGETGCSSIKLSGDEIGISFIGRYSRYDGTFGLTLQVVAVVAEQSTGIEMNSTWSAEVRHPTYNIDIATWSSSTFKRGLPYYGKISVTTIDNRPAVGINVEICAHPTVVPHKRVNINKQELPIESKKREMMVKKRLNINASQKFCSLRQVDSNGFISFELLPSEADVTMYTIKASISKLARKRRTILPRVVLPEHNILIEEQFVINSLYSPSNSFMAFVPPPNYPKATTCLSTLPVKLYFTADKDINFNIHYVVLARGDVMLSGVKQVKFREEDNIDLGLGESLLNKGVNGNPEMDPDIEASLKPVGDVEFEIELLPEYAPRMSILAYYVRDDKEVVTAHIDIPIENCFPNPVKFIWSSKRKQPGQNVTIRLKSSSGSLCGYSVVDRSVTYIRQDLQTSESTIFSRLPNFQITADSYPRQVTPEWEYCANKRNETYFQEFAEDLRRRKRSLFVQRPSGNSKDAMEAFDNAGLLVMSDLNIETRPCSIESIIYPLSLHRRGGFGRSMDILEEAEDLDPRLMMRLAVNGHSMALGSIKGEENYQILPDLKSAVQVRSYFPETWLWDLHTVNSQGEWNKQVVLPHTITTWVGRALCVSEDHGFGISSPAEIESFQPFFLELHLPYSVKRMEKVQIKISIFNYATHSLPIRLTLAYSEQFELMSDSDSAILCVPAKNSAVHHYLIHTIEIGTHNVSAYAVIDENYPGECGPEILPSASDNIIKELLVIPEGFPIERTHSQMVCPKEFNEDKTIVWDISLPDDVVEGSARAWITGVGDLMGPALQGLSSLVRLPMGCGEQNMIYFTPTIYVTQYLEATNQLDASTKIKAAGFMKNGYQRELTYRHADGSFSAFGKNDPEGSLWLTAFVVKSFAAARQYIHIDEYDLEKSVNWLASQQLENGCFPIVGTVLHKDLKGGLVDNEDNMAPLTAFTLITLLEIESHVKAKTTRKNQPSPIDILLRNTLPCLEIDETEVSDVYTKALTAYALSLAGQFNSARNIINWLMARSNSTGSLLWWEKSGSGAALSVEMTSYILLSLVKLGSNDDLLKARSIVRWLSKQRNSEGGFISTQDTVVALQAISAYASLIGIQSVDMEVLVTAGEFQNYIRIREQDRLVQRRIDLPTPLASEIKITATGEGNGCVILQATLRYNIQTPPLSKAFHLNATSMVLNEASQQKECKSKLVVCTRYTGTKMKESNMALIEIEFVSGYKIDKTLLNKKFLTEVKRHELNGDVLVLYFDYIPSQRDICVSLILSQVFKVNDTKEANVKIYDYYQPEHSKSVSYSLPNECYSPSNESRIRFPFSEMEAKSSTVSSSRPHDIMSMPSTTGSLNDATARAVDSVNSKISNDSLISISDPLSSIDMKFWNVLPAQNSDNKENINQIFHSNLRNSSDLDVPESDEAPIQTFISTGYIRGCPRCMTYIPNDFQDIYCRSKTIYVAEIRLSRGYRLRLTNNFTAQLPKPMKVNSSIDLLLEKDCQCDFFERNGGNRTVTLIGFPSAPHPLPPAKLAVGAELLIIGKNRKQLNLKTLDPKCIKEVPS